jgi:diguanylate cyclase (GGDEF)-like protein
MNFSSHTAPRFETTPGQSYRRLLNRGGQAGAVLVAGVGAAVIAGWALDIPLLRSVLPGFSSMKFNTASCFLAAGVALRLLQGEGASEIARRVAAMLSWFVIAAAGLTIFEQITGIDLGIDQFVVVDETSVVHPGQMAPATAVGFLSLGSALLAFGSRDEARARRAHLLIIPALLIATLAVVGYAYGVTSLYRVAPYTSMALHTALSFLVLSLSLLATDFGHGLTRIAVSDTVGGVICRRLLPTLPFALFAIGWLRLEGQALGLYGTEFGLALMVVLSGLVSVLAVGNTAVQLYRLDLSRKRALTELAELNAELEDRVADRTERLARVADDLKIVNQSLERLSQEDGLTGLANRRLFDSHLAMQVAMAHRSGSSLALILFDIDSFKAFNDRYGHLAGDECIKRTAQALRACCQRATDLVARWGGEEFAILLPDTDLAGAAKLAEAARQAVADLKIPHATSRAGAFVSVSGGVAALDGDTVTTPQQLIEATDQALYRAKALGRNRTVALQAEAA